MFGVYVLVVVLGIFFLYKNRQQKRSSKPLPPGPAGWPLIGSALEINDENMFRKFDEMTCKYGDIFSINMLNERIISVNNEALIREMFCGEQCKTLTNNRQTFFYGEQCYFGSQSVAFSPDGYSSVYGKMRNGMLKWINWYGSTGRGHLEKNVLAELDNVNRKMENIGNGDVDIVAIMRRSLSNTVSLALSGEAILDGDPDVNVFWDLVDCNNFFLGSKVNYLMLKFPFLRFIPGTYKEMSDKLDSSVSRLTERYVTDHQKTMVKGQIRGLVDALTEDQRHDLEAGVEPTFTDERIISNMLETVAADKRFHVIQLIANAWHIHHSEQIWGDPWKFRPERFLDENGQLLPTDHVARKNWMPFSVGRRVCTGESFARSRHFHYMASLLKKWKFIPIPGRSGSCDPRERDDFTINLTLRPKPFLCKVEKR